MGYGEPKSIFCTIAPPTDIETKAAVFDTGKSKRFYGKKLKFYFLQGFWLYRNPYIMKKLIPEKE
jgi:hypothetical protein